MTSELIIQISHHLIGEFGPDTLDKGIYSAKNRGVNALKQGMKTVPAVTVVFSELVFEVLHCVKISTVPLALRKHLYHSKSLLNQLEVKIYCLASDIFLQGPSKNLNICDY